MTNSDDYICMVCYEPFDEKIVCVTTHCGHNYCRGCFTVHMKIDDKCAMCRTCIDPGNPSVKPQSIVYKFQFRPVSELLIPGYTSLGLEDCPPTDVSNLPTDLFQNGRHLPPMTSETLYSLGSMTTSDLQALYHDSR
jgi:hypothetical protein